MQFDNGSTVTIDGGTTGGTITIAEQDANVNSAVLLNRILILKCMPCRNAG